MSLSENLQNLRKMKNMSQEELAEKLNVSRQAVSKWESGNGYPETEKIISICEVFDCSMDELVKGKITEDIKSEKNEYDTVVNKVAKNIALGVFAILIGVTILLTLIGLAPSNEAEDQYALVGVIAILISVVIAVPVFIINGTMEDDFKKRNPKIANIYTQDEVIKNKNKYTKVLAGGIGLILMGVVVMMSLMALKVFGEESVLPVAVLMLFIAAGVLLLIYAGKEIDKYDIEKYNRENTEEYKKRQDLVGKICGTIMLVATIIFLLWGFIGGQWYINWVVYPVGGILCGIVGTVLEKKGE